MGQSLRMSRDLHRAVVAQAVWDASMILLDIEYENQGSLFSKSPKPSREEAWEALDWLISEADRQDREELCILAGINPDRLSYVVANALENPTLARQLHRWGKNYLRD